MSKGRKVLSGLLSLCMVFTMLLSAFPVYAAGTTAQGTQLYVSPSGDDKAAGTLDAPLKTLEGARAKVREIKKNGLPSGGVTVNLLAGEYLVAGSSLNLTSEDSGEPGKPIVWKAYEEGTVTFTGTIAVDPANFKPVTDEAVLARLPQSAHDKVRVCDMDALGLGNIGPIPKVGYGWPELPPPLNVVVDGKSMHLSRYPDSDFVHPNHIYDGGFAPRDEYSEDPIKEAGPIWSCDDKQLVDMFELLQQEEDIWTYGYFNHTYADDNVAVKSVELDPQHGIKFTGRHPTFYGMKGNEPKKFYVYNLLCALDAPEEYYLDRTSKKLYLYSEKDLASSKIEFSVLAEPFFNLNGASHITFEGLHFTAGNANAIDLHDSHNILIADCLFSNMGQKGVSVNGSFANHDNTIQSCDFKHMGSGGVLLDGGDILSLTSGNNKVDNCYFDDYSVIKRTYTPAVDIFGCGNQVTRCKITNAPHQAVRFSGNNHLISGNEISNVLYETGDSGAIYTCTRDWTSRGNLITNNYFHDIPNITHGGTYCIYLDDMASGTIATNNLFTNMQANAFLVGGGRDNVISNNIEINNGRGFIRYDNRCMGWAHKSAHIPDGGNYKAWKAMADELNKPGNEASLAKWKDQYPGMFDPDMDTAERCGQCGAQRSKGCIPKNAVIENNIAVGGSSYSFVNEVTKYGSVKNNQSYAAGTDIGFAAPDCQDFTVKPNSKIKEIQGDAHFDITKVGMYNDEYRHIPSVDVKAPVLTQPENGAKDVPFANGAALGWQSVEGAANYLVEVSDTEDFAKVLYSGTTASTNIYVNALERHTTYYWRVTAIEGRLNGSRATSDVRSFTTEDRDPAILFESFADAEFSGWKRAAGLPSRTDRISHAGRFSYQTDEGSDVIEKNFGTAQKKVVSLWMYDTMQDDGWTASIANVSPEASSWAAVGINVRVENNQGRNYYVSRIDTADGAPWALTKVKRTKGWHEFKWDYSDGKVGRIYIDGTEVGQIQAPGFSTIKLGDPWNESGNPGNISSILYDDLRIGDPVIAPKAISIELPKELALAEGEEAQLDAVLTTDIDADMELSWTTDSQETVVLPGDGVVVGKREGTCTVTVFPTADPSVKAECKVTVSKDGPVVVDSVQKLQYDEPAPYYPDDEQKSWQKGFEERSLPLGNGYMGVNVFGGTDYEVLSFCENSMYNPYQKPDHPTEGLDSLSRTFIDFGHKNVSDYSRDLVLNDAVAHVSYTSDGVDYTREYFTSYPDKVMVMKFTASGNGNLNFTLRPTIVNQKDYGKEYEKTGTVRAAAADGSGLITLAGTMNYYGLNYEAQYKVIPAGGKGMKITAVGSDSKNPDQIRVEGADSAVILVAAGTNYHMVPETFTKPDSQKLDSNEFPHDKVSGYINAAAQKDFGALKAAHLADYQSFYNRAALNLGGKVPALCTDELLSNYKSNLLDSSESAYLEELLFQYGRYLLISSSRKGCLPAHLQGIWNFHNGTYWGSGYWHNINQQMNYWPAFNTNLIEMFEPYVDFNEAFRSAAEAKADAFVQSKNPDVKEPDGQNGWTVDTAVFPYSLGGIGSTGNTGFTSMLFWDYYDFTRDYDILKDHTYPALSGAAKFISKSLKKQPDGKWLAFESNSPEQRTGNGSGSNPLITTVGTAYDQMLAYESLNSTLTAAALLGLEQDEFLKLLSEQLPALDPVKIGYSGQVKEFREENYYGDIGQWEHRHISHMVGLYPGSLINSETPAWMDGARVALSNRGMGSTGWSISHRLCAWARLKDGNRSYDELQYLLRNQIMPNLWDMHPPHAYQIDGNLGATAGIGEMLLQSHEGYLAPLPALPDAWSTGSYRGLTGRGAFEVDANWKNGHATSFTVYSKAGEECRIQYPNIADAVVTDAAGSAVSFTKEGSDRIAFSTAAGGSYTITSIPACHDVEEPAKLSMQSDNGKTMLSWNASKDAASYNVYRSVNDDADYTLIQSGVQDTQYALSLDDVKPADRLTLRVTAVSKEGRESTGAVVYSNPIKEIESAFGVFTNETTLKIQIAADASLTEFNVYENGKFLKSETSPSFTVENADKNAEYTVSGGSSGRMGSPVRVEIKDAFPADPGDFYESFENFSDNGWIRIYKHDDVASLPNQPDIVEDPTVEVSRCDTNAHEGRYSFKLTGVLDAIKKVYTEEQKGKVVTVWIYDDMNMQAGHTVLVDFLNGISLGSDTRGNKGPYYTHGWNATSIKRSEGWHEFKFDWSDGVNCKAYVDGQLAYTQKSTGFTELWFRDSWGMGGAADHSNWLFDDITVGNPEIKPQAVSIALDQEQLTLDCGQTAALTAKIENDLDLSAETAEKYGLKPTFSSDHPEIAEVDPETGSVTAVSGGTAVITAAAGDKTAKCTVTVKQTLFTVTFSGGEGSEGTAPDPQTVAADTEIKLPENTFVKTGFVFAGWSDGTKTYQPNDVYKVPAQNITFVAQWTPAPTPEPTAEPTPEPTTEPTPKPTTEPTPEPSTEPTPEPTAEPTPEPTAEPTPEPTTEPTPEPTTEPTPEPTTEPTPEPTTEPTPEPTTEPTPEPTTEPTPEPTTEPTPEPTTEPTPEPTTEPTPEPTTEPTPEPTTEPTPEPTTEPTPEPTAEPAPAPTAKPMPTAKPVPSSKPVNRPVPTAKPAPEATAAPEPILSQGSPYADEILALTSGTDSLILHLENRDELEDNFTAKVDFGKEQADSVRYLYHYNPEQGHLEYLGKYSIDANGFIFFDLTTRDDYVFTDAQIETDEPEFSSPDDSSSSSAPESTGNPSEQPAVGPDAEQPSGGFTAWAWVLILAAILALLILVFVLVKKHHNEE